jgi:CDP-4-dehydro-6-deoxyglucose reductase
MASLAFNGRSLQVREGESVLECLLRHGERLSYSCKAGVCQSCLVRGLRGRIPERAQQGLKDSLREQGYLLACSCYLTEDLAISAAGEQERIGAGISKLEMLSESVLRVCLRTEAPLEYRAGQFITMFREDGLARSYSLASLPEERELELHVRLLAGGNMSGWLRDHARPGTKVRLRGPSGSCFYTEGKREQPILLAGTGTGLAPLYGIARDALRRGHSGDIWLFHGAVTCSGLYLGEELHSWQQQYANFHYVPAVLRGEAPEGGFAGPLDNAVLSAFPNLGHWRAFVCGDPGFVTSFRKKIFLAGVASKEIYADSFLPAAF